MTFTVYGKIRKNVNVWAECSYCLAQSYLFGVDYPVCVHEGGHKQQSSTGLVVVNRGLWWTSCLPLGPGLPFPPLRPSVPSSPRDVRWKNGKSITCILLECLEGEKA